MSVTDRHFAGCLSSSKAGVPFFVTSKHKNQDLILIRRMLAVSWHSLPLRQPFVLHFADFLFFVGGVGTWPWRCSFFCTCMKKDPCVDFIPILLTHFYPPPPPHQFCVCLCPEDIFWIAQPFVTKLSMVVRHHGPKCHAPPPPPPQKKREKKEKKKEEGCHLQVQGHSESLYNWHIYLVLLYLLN